MTHALQTNAVNGLFMTKSAEEISIRNLGQDPPPPTRKEEFHWTKYVTGDEQNIIKGSSATAYLNNRLTLNGGANVTVNALTMATNINAGTTMNLNLAPSVTYQVADTLTTGPGRVYSANRSYKTVGLDSIKFVAGLDGAERTKCLRGWQVITSAAATLLGMAASIVPPVWNHYHPKEDRMQPWHQAIGAYAASSFMFLSYWVESRAWDAFDMAVLRDHRGRIEPFHWDTSNRFGATGMDLSDFGFSVFGPRKVNPERHLTGAEREGTRPGIMIYDGDIRMAAEEGRGGSGNKFMEASIYMSLGQVSMKGGYSQDQTEIKMDINALQTIHKDWAICLDSQSLRLGGLGPVLRISKETAPLIKIDNEAMDATCQAIRLDANGAAASFDAKGARIAAGNVYIGTEDSNISITGKQLGIDSAGLVHLR